jgi:large subunit ribosomal protein L36e
MNKGHVVQRRELPPRPSPRKGYLSQKTKAVRSLIKEVVGYLDSLPYAKTVLTYLVELLLMRNE